MSLAESVARLLGKTPSRSTAAPANSRQGAANPPQLDLAKTAARLTDTATRRRAAARPTIDYALTMAASDESAQVPAAAQPDRPIENLRAQGLARLDAIRVGAAWAWRTEQ